MLTLVEARARLLALTRAPKGERVPLSRVSGRVLLEDVFAPVDWPAFDASMMDGYAVRASDVRRGARLRVSGESKTGSPFASAVAAGTTCRIFTGAVLPEGADTVVMQEDVRRDGDSAEFACDAPAPGQHVRRRGEDLRRGELTLASGTRLGPAHASLAASLERSELLVGARPRVVVLATGDELRDPGSPGALGSVPESNGVAIAAMAERCGGDAELAKRVGDRQDEVRRAVEAALERADVLVTIGGVSVGDHDVVRPALEAAGVSLDFWRVAIKPGKPVCVGTRGERFVLGLPGNPASAMVTFALFGSPLLRAMQGDATPWPSPLRLRLSHEHTRKPGRLEFARARVRGDEVELVRHQASGSALGVARADALVALEPDAQSVAKGTLVDTYLASEFGL